MGGKNKANRTKNNARPSSSARSAELLATQAPTFLNFSALKGGSVAMLPNVSSVTEDIDRSIIDVNYQIVLKKMVKKDPTTKVKALKEFVEMCEKADPEEVKTILPFWPRLYCQLCGDTEHRVRESVHQAHKTVVSKVKKSLAPYLKEIIGPWFTSQYDTYPPAASAAVAAFQEAFSPKKMVEVVAFCQEEILNYLIQNLTIHTPQTLSFPTATSEEMEAKYQRIIISSFFGYKLYLEKMNNEQLTSQEGNNKRLVGSPKFWKFATNKDPLLRHSFFTAVVALFQHGSFFLRQDINRVSSVVLNHLGESDPLVVPVIWDVVLNGLAAFPECWSHPNVEKQLIPVLMKLLRNGGDGFASSIYPTILPLLSQIPDQVMGDKASFYNKLFCNMKEGLESVAVNRSLSESRIVAETFIECLKYAVILEIKDSDLTSQLIKNHLLEAIKSRLQTTTIPQYTTVPFYYQISSLLRFWHRNGETCGNIANSFWLQLIEMLNLMIKEDLMKADIELILNSQVEFLTVIQVPKKYTPKSGRERVRFSDKTKVEAIEEVSSEPLAPEFDAACLNCAKELGFNYYEQFKVSQEYCYLKSLLKLAKIFKSSCVLGAFVDEYSWVIKKLPQDAMVEMCADIIPYVSEKEQKKIIEELNILPDDVLIEVCKGLLVKPTPVIKKWLQSSEFTTHYVRLLKLFILDVKNTMNSDVIKQFIVPDILLADNCLDKIVETLISVINDHIDVNYEHLLEIISFLPGNFSSLNKFETFISLLFEKSCRTGNEDLAEVLSKALYKVKHYLGTTKLMSLCVNLASVMPINVENIKFTVKLISKIIEIASQVNLLDTCDADEIEDAIPFIKIFLEPSELIKKYRASILHLIQKLCVTGGYCSEQYYILKSNYNIETSNIDSEPPQFSSFKNTHNILIPYEKSSAIEEAIQNYLEWNLLVCSLLTLIVKAYPCSSKLEDLNHPGRYCVSGEGPPEMKETNIIPREISSEELQDLLEEKSIFETEEYPDKNLIRPIANLILYFIEGYSTIEILNNLAAHTHFGSLVEPSLQLLLISGQDLLLFTTPKEFQYIFELCDHLVKTEPIWEVYRQPLTNLFFRRFTKGAMHVADEMVKDIISSLSESNETFLNGLLFLNSVVFNNFNLLDVDQWSSIFIGLDNILKTALEENEIKEEHLLQMGAISCFYINSLKAFVESEDLEESHPKFDSELIKMWNDVVENELWLKLFTFWKKLAVAAEPRPGEEEEPAAWLTHPYFCVALRTFCTAVICGLKQRDVKSKKFLEIGDSFLFNCANVLLSRSQSLQFTAFIIIMTILEDLVNADTETFHNGADVSDSESTFTTSRNCDWNLKVIQSTLTAAQTVVEALFSHFKMGDTCVIQPFTDGFTYTQGYLLIWSILAESCSKAHAALRYQYALWLKQNGHLSSFLNSIFKLMPTNVVHGEDNRNTLVYFENTPEIDLNAPVKNSGLEHRACFVYRLVLQTLPAAVRDWCGELDHLANNLVSRVTKAHVSPILIAWELRGVKTVGTDLENVNVRTSVPTRELIATYGVDEVMMQMTITLPPNYPLCTVKVDMNTTSVVPRGSRIVRYLINRNGSLQDALALWKSDLDKKFDGLEECEICFSILHGPNMEIPKQACKTCHKKFHAACLYKWFSTSNKSSCPHCRNLY